MSCGFNIKWSDLIAKGKEKEFHLVRFNFLKIGLFSYKEDTFKEVLSQLWNSDSLKILGWVSR